eukprot:4898731-Pyramimonas_sp.AAC.1
MKGHAEVPPPAARQGARGGRRCLLAEEGRFVARQRAEVPKGCLPMPAARLEGERHHTPRGAARG